jgi:predicted NAD/FAD-dependent oxidoreductase
MARNTSSILEDTMVHRASPRIAIVGGGIAGLTCARELGLRGFSPVVFEADDRLGGRCSSRSTRVGMFDDGAQYIGGATRLAVHAVQRPGELALLHPWTVAATPAEERRTARAWKKRDEDEAEVTRTLKLLGAVGVPSMVALADALARPLDVRINTPISRASRRGSKWVLSSPRGEHDEDFEALVLAIPAPLAMPLVAESPELTNVLRGVRYRSRWVLLLGSERPIPLPSYRQFQGSPIERVAAMHSKPGRCATGPQRWFVEADQRWSLQHEHEDAEAVADLLLDNFREHAGRSVMPNFLCAQQWQHAFVQTPATTPRRAECLWDNKVQLGICGDSVVESQVDRVHRSGADMARAVAEGLLHRSGHSGFVTLGRDFERSLEAQL